MKTAAELLEKLDSERLKRRVTPLDYSVAISGLLPEIVAVLKAADHYLGTGSGVLELRRSMTALNHKAQEGVDANI